MKQIESNKKKSGLKARRQYPQVWDCLCYKEEANLALDSTPLNVCLPHFVDSTNFWMPHIAKNRRGPVVLPYTHFTFKVTTLWGEAPLNVSPGHFTLLKVPGLLHRLVVLRPGRGRQKRMATDRKGGPLQIRHVHGDAALVKGDL